MHDEELGGGGSGTTDDVDVRNLDFGGTGNRFWFLSRSSTLCQQLQQQTNEKVDDIGRSPTTSRNEYSRRSGIKIWLLKQYNVSEKEFTNDRIPIDTIIAIFDSDSAGR